MRRLGQLALVWLALFWLWLAFQGQLDRVMTAAAAATALVATALAAWVARWFPRGYRLERRWLKHALKVPWDVVRDFGVVTRVLAAAIAHGERPGGSFRLSPFPVGRNEPVARGRRAFVSMIRTYSPNSYVVAMLPDEHGALLHDLDEQPPEGGVL